MNVYGFLLSHGETPERAGVSAGGIAARVIRTIDAAHRRDGDAAAAVRAQLVPMLPHRGAASGPTG